jgi:hypothetical protein
MHILGKYGNVYGNALLVEDCEDTWAEQVVGGVALSAETGKVGTYCARATTTTVGATTLLMSEAITKDLSTYDGVYWWARSSINTVADDLELHLSQHADCATPEETLAFPALTAATWRQCFTVLVAPAGVPAVISVGLYQKVNLADGTFDIDDVQALKEIDGIKSWTLDYTQELVDVTDFDDAGAKTYIVGASDWGGTFEGYKDGVPLSIGAEVHLVLGESVTAYNNWIGKAYLTGVHPAVSFDGVVSYTYDFKGTGVLQAPLA